MALTHAILTCLIESPHSGYDLSKLFSESVGYFWNASQQQIYRELSKLETQGLIVSELIPREGRLDKKIYSITDLGRQYLVEWMQKPTQPDVIREALLVKVFAGGLVSVEILTEDINHHRKIHLDKLTKYREIEQELCSDSTNLNYKQKLKYLVLRAGILHETEWINWCDEALTVLKEIPS
ncbi:MAG: PadR family transcriptional regulator [Sphaerospermopsis kisseleviana]